jgi:large subunit ribosomal protein L25
MKVPLHFSGQETSPAFKVDNCLITHVTTELQITCSPADLPEFIAVDLSTLTKGVSLHASDLTLPKGVKVIKRGTNDPVIVSVVAQAVEEAPAAAAATDAKAAPAKKAPAKK